MFVRTPDAPEKPDPIIVPAPEQKTAVYVLTKNPSFDQKIIEVPSPPQAAPEVFYVNYDKGEKPEIPDGPFGAVEVPSSVLADIPRIKPLRNYN